MFSRTLAHLAKRVTIAQLQPISQTSQSAASLLSSSVHLNAVSAASNNLSCRRHYSDKKTINVTFVRANGERLTAAAKVGDNLLDVVINNNIDLDGFGACEGTLTCSTCHLIFTPADFERLPSKPCDEELDMLDLAYDLCDTSRLGCQVELTADMDGLEVRVPSTINDARS